MPDHVHRCQLRCSPELLHQLGGRQCLGCEEEGFLQPAPAELRPMFGHQQQMVADHGNCTGFLVSRRLLLHASIWEHGQWSTTPEDRPAFKDRDVGWHPASFLRLASLTINSGTRIRSKEAQKRRICGQKAMERLELRLEVGVARLVLVCRLRACGGGRCSQQLVGRCRTCGVAFREEAQKATGEEAEEATCEEPKPKAARKKPPVQSTNFEPVDERPKHLWTAQNRKCCRSLGVCLTTVFFFKKKQSLRVLCLWV